MRIEKQKPDQNVAWPHEIPPKGWLVILQRSLARVFADNIGVLAGGVAFYAFLSIFPALAGALMIWGVFAEGSTIGAHLGAIQVIMPGRVFDLVSMQMIRIATQNDVDLSVGAMLTLLFALWSASRGVAALMGAMNMAYHEREKRGFLLVNGLALLFTLGGVAFAALSFAAISAVPPVIEAIIRGSLGEALVALVRWLLVVAVFMASSALIYRLAPSRQHARWRWIAPGAACAALMWLGASFAFSFYLTQFDAYNATFGSLGAVAALLMWLWLSAYAVCAGAELNAQLELYTTMDTTVGDAERAGHRGAFVADHVARETISSHDAQLQSSNVGTKNARDA
jgi:membrane protein